MVLVVWMNVAPPALAENTNTTSSTSSQNDQKTPTQSIDILESPSNLCTIDQIEVTVEVFTDKYPHETTWEFRNASNGVVEASGGNYSNQYSRYEEKVCLAETDTCTGTNYTFTIHDRYGDGICCLEGIGNYSVFLDGERIVTGDTFVFFERTSLCRKEVLESNCEEYTTRKTCIDQDNDCFWFARKCRQFRWFLP